MLDNDRSAKISRLRLAPYRSPLACHRGTVLWGCWGQVRGRPVLVTGGTDRAVRLWDPAGREPQPGRLLPIDHAGAVLWGCWGQAGGRPVLATGGTDSTVRLWDVEMHAPLGLLPIDPPGRLAGGASGS